jgi:tetratricopeptide (TPR) repeat protein
MNDNPASDLLVLQNCTRLNGRDVLSDPGLAQFRRYLPVLAVIAAPYAGLGGDQDPLNPLDRAGEWRALLRLVAVVNDLQTDASTRLALARLDPPTAARLGTALAVSGPDAFQVVHLVCHGERDMLYLEDDHGHEAYAVAEHVTSLFKTSGARLVVMDGCFSHRITHLLIDETPVRAVVGTRRRVNPENMLAFAASFYAQLTSGASVRVAYRAALGVLDRRPGGQADRFELVVSEDMHEITLPLPEAQSRASRPLVTESAVRVADVPQLPGFVGRREELTMLAEDIPAAGVRLFALQGPPGIGKSWLAAEFASRFSWRFPDGVLWFPCNAMTTCAEIVAQVARLLDLPVHSAAGAVLDALNGRRMLLVIDGVDALDSWAELERLGAWVRDIPAENCAILTAHHLSNLLPRAGESRSHTMTPFSYKAARTLAMRLAVGRGIDALDVDTIDDFLDRTRNWPALIVQGVALVEAAGIDTALHDLGALDPETDDPVAAFLVQRFQALVTEPDNPLLLLIRAQGLPGAFDDGLARVLGGNAEQAELLVKHGLLRREGAWFAVAPGVRAFLETQSPLSPEQQDLIDRDVMTYLIETWPAQDGAPVQVDCAMWARLHNLRAMVQRQLRPHLTVDLRILAHVLAVAGRAFAAVGLGEEFLAYAQGFRERLPEGPELARLQTVMGEVLDLLPDQESEAGWAFQMSLRLDGLDTATRAGVCRALGRHLVHVDQVEAAERFLSESLRQLLTQVRRGNVVLAAALAHEWANALARLDRHTEAVRRFEAALAGYAEAQEAAFSALAQYDLSLSLIRLGEIDRAEDVLRRALVTADYAGRRDLTRDIRQRLAQVHTERADEEHHTGQRTTEREELRAAESCLSDALLDTLVLNDSASLATIYHDLARVQARLGWLDEALAHAVRSKTLLERSTGDSPDLVETAITLGQLHMAHGDSVAAQEALLEALDRATAAGDSTSLAQAAGVLVRVHQIRARRAPQAGLEFRRYTLDQASRTRARFIDLGLGEHANALGEVIQFLTS